MLWISLERAFLMQPSFSYKRHPLGAYKVYAKQKSPLLLASQIRSKVLMNDEALSVDLRNDKLIANAIQYELSVKL